VLAAFKGMADGISALAGHDSFGPGSLSTGRWRGDPLEVAEVAIQAVAVLEPDDVARRSGTGERLQDNLGHKAALRTPLFIVKRDYLVAISIDQSRYAEPVFALLRNRGI
jgi:hypothetical protein